VAATAVICGAGAHGYLLSIRAIDDLWAAAERTQQAE